MYIEIMDQLLKEKLPQVGAQLQRITEILNEIQIALIEFNDLIELKQEKIAKSKDLNSQKNMTLAVNLAGIAGFGWLALVSAGPMAVVCSLAAIGLTASSIFIATSET